jgi:hypothetical protein
MTSMLRPLLVLLVGCSAAVHTYPLIRGAYVDRLHQACTSTNMQVCSYTQGTPQGKAYHHTKAAPQDGILRMPHSMAAF